MKKYLILLLIVCVTLFSCDMMFPKPNNNSSSGSNTEQTTKPDNNEESGKPSGPDVNEEEKIDYSKFTPDEVYHFLDGGTWTGENGMYKYQFEFVYALETNGIVEHSVFNKNTKVTESGVDAYEVLSGILWYGNKPKVYEYIFQITDENEMTIKDRTREGFTVVLTRTR